MKNHHYQDLITLFNDTFIPLESTILVNGGIDPIYLPRDDKHLYHRIIFQGDYYSSAFHEISHWCIAGKKRRQLVDYGYWYQPGNYITDETSLLMEFEAKVQAIEWIFCVAVDIPFYVSIGDGWSVRRVSEMLKQKIYENTRYYFDNGLPKRAELFKQRLLTFYEPERLFKIEDFMMANLL